MRMTMIALALFISLCRLSPVQAAPESEGSFAVSSKSTGTVFTNPYNCQQRMEVTPTGLWSYWPVTGWSGPEGNRYVTNDSTVPMPGAHDGALLVRHQDGRYEIIDDSKVLWLEANESVAFRINDSDRGLFDNRGAVLVDWKLSKHCH